MGPGTTVTFQCPGYRGDGVGPRDPLTFLGSRRGESRGKATGDTPETTRRRPKSGARRVTGRVHTRGDPEEGTGDEATSRVADQMTGERT